MPLSKATRHAGDWIWNGWAGMCQAPLSHRPSNRHHHCRQGEGVACHPERREEEGSATAQTLHKACTNTRSRIVYKTNKTMPAHFASTIRGAPLVEGWQPELKMNTLGTTVRKRKNKTAAPTDQQPCFQTPFPHRVYVCVCVCVSVYLCACVVPV